MMKQRKTCLNPKCTQNKKSQAQTLIVGADHLTQSEEEAII